MGRRARSRGGQAPARRSPGDPPPTQRARSEEAPPAPWHPFPLVELAIFIGLVIVVAGFVTSDGTLLGIGVALISLASLELAVREHFAGFRSHTTLLAGAVAVLVAAPLALLGVLPQLAVAGVAAVVGVVAWRLLRMAFTRRTGGLAWRA